VRGRQALTFAVLLSISLHLTGFVSPAWWSEEIPTSAPRLVAHFSRVTAGVAKPGQIPAPAAPIPLPTKKHPLPKPRPHSTATQLPPVPEAPAEASAPEPVVEQSNGVSPPVSENSAPPEKTSPPEDMDSQPVEPRPIFSAQRLPRKGKVMYTGTAGAFVALTAIGQASWEHDGEHFQSHLSAGLASPDSSLDFQSTGRIVGEQMISETTHDNRRGKVSTGQIDQSGGMVTMQRGTDTRERSIKGLAVAISALPELLMTLDESVDKAALFVVGDFWVADSILVKQGREFLRLPAGNVETRHYATQTNSGTLIDVWLAPGWRNAPARIRIESNGIVVDLKASQVEVDGKVVAQTPDQPNGN
jgi:hypothetical protein